MIKYDNIYTNMIEQQTYKIIAAINHNVCNIFRFLLIDNYKFF